MQTHPVGLSGSTEVIKKNMHNYCNKCDWVLGCNVMHHINDVVVILARRVSVNGRVRVALTSQILQLGNNTG